MPAILVLTSCIQNPDPSLAAETTGIVGNSAAMTRADTLGNAVLQAMGVASGTAKWTNSRSGTANSTVVTPQKETISIRIKRNSHSTVENIDAILNGQPLVIHEGKDQVTIEIYIEKPKANKSER